MHPLYLSVLIDLNKLNIGEHYEKNKCTRMCNQPG
jgi:hypothetical protein